MSDRELEAIRNLVRHVAYTEHWLRDTEAFEKACIAVGYEYRPGKGLFQAIPSPYEAGAQ